MTSDFQRRQRYALIVLAVTFLCLLAAAGVRSAPSVLMLPWERAFGWDRSTISLAAGTGIFLYGLMGPFAAALMQSFGLRRTLSGALMLMSLSAALSLFMSEPWQLIATWGVLSGIGSGCVALVLAATIVNRWFRLCTIRSTSHKNPSIRTKTTPPTLTTVNRRAALFPGTNTCSTHCTLCDVAFHGGFHAAVCPDIA